MRRKRLSITLSIFIVCTILTGGCGEGTTNLQQKEQVTIDFLDDTVFTVGTQRVSKSEWFMYMEPEREKTEKLYGKEIWDYPVDKSGRDYYEALKENIKEQIIYVRIVCDQAEKLDITLTEDEQIDIDIQTKDYMSQIKTDELEKHQINEDLVKKIYSDNQLAMKVYENLTLNVNTDIPEDEVRHMVLQYIMLLKSYKDANGISTFYTGEEIRTIKENAEGLLKEIEENDMIVTLNDIQNDAYIVNELVADKEMLKEKLPENIAETAFNLRKNEISDLLETNEAFFILDCVSESDNEATNAAKIKIIEERQNNLFSTKFKEWEAETVIKINYEVWDKLDKEDV